MKPVPQTQEEVVATLRDMLEVVAASDSWEGSMEYLMPTDEKVPDGTFALVRASYRVGNSMGQGGVRMVGEVVASEEPFPYGWFVAKPVWLVKGYVITKREPGTKDGRDRAEMYFTARNLTEAARWAPELLKRGWGSDMSKLDAEIVSLERQGEEVVIPRWGS